MALVFRRLLSSSLNAAVIVFILILAYLFLAFLLWFLPLTTHLTARWSSLAFAVTYSSLGAYSIGFLPQMGNRVARIETLETRSGPSRRTKIAARLLLVYAMPSLALGLLGYPFIVPSLHDGQALPYLLIPSVFCAAFSLLLIPVSIIVGRGTQGIHDALSGMQVCRRGGKEPPPVLPLRPLISRTVIACSIVAFAISAAFFQVLISTKLHDSFFDLFAKQDGKTMIQRTRDDFVSIVPHTPVKCTKYDTIGSFKLWVDLTCKDSEKASLMNDIGLPLMNYMDLLGYGFSSEQIAEPISLLHMDRARTDSLPVGSKVLTVFMFLHDGAFYYPEIKGIIERHLLTKVGHHKTSGEFDALRVKLVRMVKVGLVTVGYFEEYFIYKNNYWRNQKNAYIPGILTFDTRSISGAPNEYGSFITSSDIR